MWLAAAVLAQGSPEYFPMNEGQVWKYRDVVYADKIKGGNTVIGFAAKKTKIGEADGFQLDSTGESYFLFQQMWVTLDKEGIMLHKIRSGGEDRPLPKPQMFLPAVLKKGARWSGETPGGKYEATCESDDEAVEIYLGKFQKVKRVSFKFDTIVAVCWLAREVGPIRFKYTWEFKETNEKISRDAELNDVEGIASIEFEYECAKCKKIKAKPGTCCGKELVKVPKNPALRHAAMVKSLKDKLFKESKVTYDFSKGGRGTATLRETLNLILGAAEIPWELDKAADTGNVGFTNASGEGKNVYEVLERVVLKPLNLRYELKNGKVFITK
jgi:hypothetical protein